MPELKAIEVVAAIPENAGEGVKDVLYLLRYRDDPTDAPPRAHRAHHHRQGFMRESWLEEMLNEAYHMGMAKGVSIVHRREAVQRRVSNAMVALAGMDGD